MSFYWIKTNWIIKRVFKKFIWDIPNEQNEVYLTFDDGPIPKVTTWVLEQLNQYNFKGTFFCIGRNIEQNPAIFKTIIQQGHSIGNHTFEHLNGWQTKTEDYIKSIKYCEDIIRSASTNNSKPTLFRPPYGKLKKSQSVAIRQLDYKIILWDVLSADFDVSISKEKCLDNVLSNIKPGSIIVFHDSVKAFENLSYALPKTLEYLHKNNFKCSPL